jgi:hypothetical protein
MTLYHTRFSTGPGAAPLFFEDMVVGEPVCDHGVERRLMARLASDALERGWGRSIFWGGIDFDVWKRARRFDDRLGFGHHDEWLRYDVAKGLVERLRRMGRARLNSER